MHATSCRREATMTRLKALLEVALCGWMENLPVAATEAEEVWTVRRQRLAIHEMRAEADEILRMYYPPPSTNYQ